MFLRCDDIDLQRKIGVMSPPDSLVSVFPNYVHRKTASELLVVFLSKQSMIGRLLSNYIDTHMKTKAIFLASVLLVGCQTSKVGVQAPVQHAQSLSSAGQESEAGEYTNSARVGSARWLDSESSLAQQDLWNFISDELKMKVPENSRIREQKQKYLKIRAISTM